SVFLGAALPGPACGEDCPIEASVQGGVVAVRRRAGAREVVRADLASARLDSDGDGLTDFVERRLGTLAGRTDSDGDGIADAVDPFPRTRSHAPSSEVEEATAAVLEQFHLFDDDGADLAVLVGDPAGPASGREGPTLVVGRKALDAFKAR